MRLGMDTVEEELVEIPIPSSSSSMAKRPCPSQNPRMELEHLLYQFLSLSDRPSLSLNLSFENLLQSMPPDSDLIDRALKMGSLLLDAAKHSSRKRASNHNSIVWPLPPDLTFKVYNIFRFSIFFFQFYATFTFYYPFFFLSNSAI
jgi:F-box/leucine-rich repeat protein 2/20